MSLASVNREDGYIGITEAAKLASMPRKVMRRRLMALQRRHGGVLFRFSDSPNAKLWTTPQALRRLMPERFDEPSLLDLIELRMLVLELTRRVGILELRLKKSGPKVGQS